MAKQKKLQDLIGIRIVLYFNDDIQTVRHIVSSLYEERSSDVSIDEYKNDEFKAVRYKHCLFITPIRRKNLKSKR